MRARALAARAATDGRPGSSPSDAAAENVPTRAAPGPLSASKNACTVRSASPSRPQRTRMARPRDAKMKSSSACAQPRCARSAVHAAHGGAFRRCGARSRSRAPACTSRLRRRRRPAARRRRRSARRTRFEARREADAQHGARPRGRAVGDAQRHARADAVADAAAR
ncbi:hypothetical protein M885DRAFT_133284 [Pelagophyceae sp. CCMP2097]|nr:hypothetical protein M885DRAFT_133284 [Pelagophyceae sp. CCMP2097]